MEILWKITEHSRWKKKFMIIANLKKWIDFEIYLIHFVNVEAYPRLQ
jgi:hypothetical protein